MQVSIRQAPSFAVARVDLGPGEAVRAESGAMMTMSADVRLDVATEITAAEMVFLIRHEFAVRLSDLLLRRTALAIRGDVSMTLIERIGDILAIELGLDPQARTREVESFIEELDRYLDMMQRRVVDGQ